MKPSQEAQRQVLDLYFDIRRRVALQSAPPSSGQWQRLVNAKVAAGLSRVEAIIAVAKEQPALYEAQSTPKEEQTAPTPAPRVSWDGGQVDANMRRGMSEVEAIRAAMRRN